MSDDTTSGPFNASAGGGSPPRPPQNTRLASRPASKVMIMVLQGHLSTPTLEMHLTPMGTAMNHIREENDRRIRAEIEEHRKRLALRQDVAKEAFGRHAPDPKHGFKP